MLGRTRRVHFVGIGGSGMSGIAELLANLGYAVIRLRREAVRRHRAPGVARRPRGGGARRGERRRRRRRRLLVGRAADEPRDRRGHPAAHPGHPARRDARRADAAEVRRRGRRRARQDHDDVDDRARARAGRPRPDGGHRRAAQRLRQQRAPRPRRLHGGGSRRERPLVPEAHAVDRRHHEHRPGAPRELPRLRGPAAGVRRLRQQGAVLRRRSSRAPTTAYVRAAAAGDDAARDHLRPRRARRALPRRGRLGRGLRLALHRRARPAADEPRRGRRAR